MPPEPRSSAPTPAATAAGRARSARDPRLDLFRGIAMLIIFIAHVPWNYWADFIPARWGASDAAEMFVLCSGYAAALAFGGTFVKAGFLLGSVRILFRCWQVYWAHVGLFVVVLALTVAADRLWPRGGIEILPEPQLDYVHLLGLGVVTHDLPGAFLGLATLTWIPNYFDILPMYLVILAMVPVVMALQRVDTRLAIAAVVGVWLLNLAVGLDLPAEPWSDRPWFFNPFAWQLLFFTGFFLARGWLPRIPYDRRLALAALAYVLILVPIAQYRFWPLVPLEGVHEWLLGGEAKSDFHLVRYLHILALAYLALYALDRWPAVLASPLLRPVVKVGQQALPTFLTSMTLAWAGGMVLDHLGRTAATYALVNLTGLGLVVAVAYLVGWIKAEPWQAARPTAERQSVRATLPLAARAA